MTTFASAPNLDLGLLFQSLFFFLFVIRFSEILQRNHDPRFKNAFAMVFWYPRSSFPPPRPTPPPKVSSDRELSGPPLKISPSCCQGRFLTSLRDLSRVLLKPFCVTGAERSQWGRGTGRADSLGNGGREAAYLITFLRPTEEVVPEPQQGLDQGT